MEEMRTMQTCWVPHWEEWKGINGAKKWKLVCKVYAKCMQKEHIVNVL